ncbi:MAG TPA: carboxypeptidase regulatory-like domain-containing protein [Polyangia bacterium]|nr:carboxypeptidase regulatory-like domain-containing protein [Polyangia bacterium]
MPPNFQNARPLVSAAVKEPAPEDTLTTTEAVGPTGPATGGNSDSYLPSLSGPIGLYRVSTADVGPRNHLRLALHGEFFTSSGLLIEGDQDKRLLGDFTFGFTVHPNVEIFGALLSSSNRNTRDSELGRRDPELIKSFGDLVLGGKAAFPVGTGISVGFEGGFKFLSAISDLSFSADSTSFWLGPLATIDLRPLVNAPVRFHVNANFYADNSRNLRDLSTMATATDGNVVTEQTKWVAQFAYGMGASRFRAAVGVEATFDQILIPLQPFAEYHAEIVTADADATFAEYMPPACDTPGGLPCKDNRDQQWVTAGLRARLWKGLTADAGVDVRIRSVGFPYGPPLPPYNVVFGVAYPLDIDAFRRPVIVTIEKEAPPTVGTVVGQVKDAKDGKPVGAAIVAAEGRSRARVATDPDGSFRSAPLEPGPAVLEISAAGYETSKVTAKVVAGQPVDLASVALTPKTPMGNVRGKISDDKGTGLQASLKFMGPDNFEAKSDAMGLFSASLPAGPYRVVAEAPGFPTKEAALDVAAAQDKQLNIALRNRPPNPNVTLNDTGISLKQPVRFVSGTAKLSSAAQPGLDGVADVMDDHLEIRTLRIEAHWDATAGDKSKELTQQQADAVKAYLVKKGVAESRIEAVGMGSDKPLVPNIGPASKTKNRRVELTVVK